MLEVKESHANIETQQLVKRKWKRGLTLFPNTRQYSTDSKI